MNASPFSSVLITGAGSGLGRQLALVAAEHGAAIAGIDINEPGLRELAEQLAAKNQKMAWALADVTHAAALAACVQELEGQIGPIDLAIANAGIGKETSALNLNADDMAQVIGVNLIGVSNTMAAVLPGMLQRKKGHLAAISSLASYRGLPRLLGYCASKSGVNALMEGMRLEVEPHGLRVTTVCPGWIRTPLTQAMEKTIKDMLSVEEAAARIWRAIVRGKRFHAFPRWRIWQRRILNMLPRAWQDWAIRKMFKRLPRMH